METPYGFCHCNCGEKTPIIKKTRNSRGQIKGQPMRFCLGHALRITQLYAIEDHGYKTPCWICMYAMDRFGYAQFVREGRTQRVHRWMYIQKFGSIPEELEPDHLCRVRACINPNHLELIPHVENVRRGASTKLNPESVRQIRLLRSQGMAYAQLVEKFNISSAMIGRILMRQAWVDID